MCAWEGLRRPGAQSSHTILAPADPIPLRWQPAEAQGQRLKEADAAGDWGQEAAHVYLLPLRQRPQGIRHPLQVRHSEAYPDSRQVLLGPLVGRRGGGAGTVPGGGGELFAQDPVSASCPERPWGVAHPQTQAQFVRGRTSVRSPPLSLLGHKTY